MFLKIKSFGIGILVGSFVCFVLFIASILSGCNHHDKTKAKIYYIDNQTETSELEDSDINIDVNISDVTSHIHVSHDCWPPGHCKHD